MKCFLHEDGANFYELKWYLSLCMVLFQEGRLTKLIDDRYSSFNSPLGKLIEVTEYSPYDFTCSDLERSFTHFQDHHVLCLLVVGNSKLNVGNGYIHLVGRTYGFTIYGMPGGECWI